jgi:Aldo/keto reductase family
MNARTLLRKFAKEAKLPRDFFNCGGEYQAPPHADAHDFGRPPRAWRVLPLYWWRQHVSGHFVNGDQCKVPPDKGPKLSAAGWNLNHGWSFPESYFAEHPRYERMVLEGEEPEADGANRCKRIHVEGGYEPHECGALVAVNPQRPDYQLRIDGEVVPRFEYVLVYGGAAAEAGLSLIHLALGFVVSHPAVTSAILGPRTMDHLESQLGAPSDGLPADLLDRIDEIVSPGVNLNPADGSYVPPSLTDPPLRRRT